MTAMAAEKDAEGPVALWYGLDDTGELDVLRALGAQCRAAVRGARDAGLELDLFSSPRSAPLRDTYPHATEILEAIVHSRSWAMPDLPACASCRMTVAAMLCSLAVSAGRRSGLSAELIAHHCRQAAEQVAAL